MAILNPPFQELEQALVGDGVKVAANVELEKVGVPPAPIRGAQNGRFGALAGTAGVAVGDLEAVEHGFQDIHDRVVEHALAKRGGAD